MEEIKEESRRETVKGLMMQAWTNKAMLLVAEEELREMETGESPDEKLLANKRMEIRTHTHNYEMQVRFATILEAYK